MRSHILISVFTALSASLCCITPILALTASTGSIASTFSWMEPFRPYFISATIAVLGFSWFRNLTTKKKDDCGCEPKVSFVQTKKFLSVVTILSLLLITFPTYSRFIFDTTSDSMGNNPNNYNKIELAVNGMTCTSCELHIEGEVKKLPGISFIKASYENGSAIVEFDDSKIKKEDIVTIINGTGYSVDTSRLNFIPQK